jgi:uncharacterized repeat protein (TIGR01451 family)
VEQLETRLTPSVLGTFELDGNATTGVVGPPGSTTASHDWDQVFADAGSPASPSGSGSFENGALSKALAGSFEYDLVNTTSDTIFTAGGSKDTNGIQSGPWRFTDSKPQAKDDIENLFASAYTDASNGHMLLYAGMTRYDNSGDSTAGFWFLQDPTFGLSTTTPTSSGSPFTGQHMDGDILLVSDFSIGGSTSTISVYQWQGSDATGKLVFIGGNSTNTFAIVNSSTVTLPWSFIDKGNTGGTGSNKAAHGELLEEGVDLTALGLTGNCFSTFEGETRSSTSPTATLSDFGFHSFPLCGAAAQGFTGISKPGDDVAYAIKATNTGIETLYLKSVIDTSAQSWGGLGSLVVNGVAQSPVSPVKSITVLGLGPGGSLPAGATVEVDVVRTVQASDPDAMTDTTAFDFRPRPDFSGMLEPANTTNTVDLFHPSATLTVTPSAMSATVGTPITYTYTLTNTTSSSSISPSGIPAIVLDATNQGAGDRNTFMDSLFGDIEADAVAAMPIHPSAGVGQLPAGPGESFSFTETHTLTSSDPTPLLESATVVFTLAQNLGSFSNQISASSMTTVHVVDANISIVPNAVNEVGAEHTFVVTVNQILDSHSSLAAGANVTVTLTNANGASFTQFDSVPLTLSGTTDSNGHFSVSFTSLTAGQVIGNAMATLTVSGVPLTRGTGDSHTGDSGPATKTFEDAEISIAPNATNEIGHPHTFTVTVLQNAGDGAGFVAAANDPVSVALTSTNGANAVPSTPLSGMTDAGGHFSVTFTSATAGQVIGNATTSFTLNGVTLSRATGDSHVGDSGPATKTFEDATISISPSGINEINHPHTFTVTVLQNAGDGNGFVAAANDPVTISLTSLNGANAVPSGPLSGTTDASGHFSVAFTSATAGEVIGNASTTFTLNGVTLMRATGDSHVGDSGPVTKFFEDATISIVPSATNEVGNPHTFLVTVLQNAGDGKGFVAAASDPVTVTLTDSNGAASVPSTPLSGTTDANGHFSVTFTSATAGQTTGSATTTFTLNGVTLTRTTGDSNVGDSGTVIKTFVDATVAIAPNATNGITESHTFTVTAMQNAGDGKGFVAASGANVSVTLTAQNGAVVMLQSPASGTADASGHFSVTLTSDSAGQVIGNATITVTVGGVMLTRATGDSHTGDGGPATKTFVSGKLLWKKVDENGNLLGGATFLVTAIGGTAGGLSPTSVQVLDNGPFDANSAAGLFELDAYQIFGGSALTGLALGTYTVQEITPPTGYTLDPKVLSTTLTQSHLVGDLTDMPFVDTLPHLSITKAATNGVTTVHPGGTASFTITVSNTGAGTALNVVMNDQLPDVPQLTWTITSFTGFTAASISSSGFLTATEASMPGGASDSVVVSAAIPLNIFGNTGGPANGDSVPLNLFELDGNATTGVVLPPGSSGSTTPSHDWDQVYADNTANPKTNTAGAVASAFLTDEVTGDDIYTGGSTKDTLPVSGWLYKTAKPQDKDEITHAFAAQYIDPTTKDVILYAGLDRFDNSGDSTAGFWFFVNPVGKTAPGNVGGSGTPFSGTHTDGDILLISDFTIGGSTSTIRVFKWQGNDATGKLVPLNNGNPINGSTFAIVNNAPISVPWSYTNKSGQHQPQAGEFLEEGVNLSGLGLNGCFSSFLAETRSSQSPTATLSDFILGNFNTCDIMLPNQASVKADNFNNGQPITSNTVVIDVNDQMMAAQPLSGTANPLSVTSSAAQQPQTATTLAASQSVAGADVFKPSSVQGVSSLAPWHAKTAKSAWDADAFIQEVLSPILLPI